MKVVYHPVRKEPWAFMMEMSTDGDVSTIDVIFPASSQLLLFSPVGDQNAVLGWVLLLHYIQFTTTNSEE